MKKITYLLMTMLLISSCRSIDKMIESGNYDKALRFGVDKLRGEKNKKTKYVKGLEKAFAKLNLQDEDQIKNLRLSGNRNNFDRIVDIYQRLDSRQKYVMPLLPLISEDGYLADIRIKDYSEAINKASLAASEKHYVLATKYLESAKKTGNKKEARNAYGQFEEARFYFTDYKDSYQLMQESYELGQSRILIESYTTGSNIAFDHTLDIILQVNTNTLNNKWEKFYTQDNGSMVFNYIATLEVTEIVPGLERERLHTYTETKEIKDGRIVVKDKKGNVVKDTSGNIIYTDRIKEVSAYVSEVEREKIAHLQGRLVIIEAVDNIHINTIPINVTHEFRDYSCTFRGDKRALTKLTLNRIKNSCDPFPTDYEITSMMAYSYKSVAEEKLHKQYFRK